MSVSPQPAYNIYQNSGGGTYALRRLVQNNVEEREMGPVPQDFGLLGWTINPGDVDSNTQAIVSGTQYFVRLNNPANLSAANNNQINKVGLQIGTTAAATPGTYSGFAVYSYTLGATTMTKLADTGATNGAAWVTSGASNYMEGTLTTPVSATPGYLYLSFIATFTTTPTIWVNDYSPQVIKMKGVTVTKTYSLAAQTSFASTVTVSGLTTGTFIPLMGIANS